MLQLGVRGEPRPIDDLILQLEEEGPEWLQKAVEDRFGTDKWRRVLQGTIPLDKLIRIKEESKTVVAEARTRNESLIALAVYGCVVASAVVHHHVLISGLAPEAWQEFLTDFADVAPLEWRDLLFDAAIRVVQLPVDENGT